MGEYYYFGAPHAESWARRKVKVCPDREISASHPWPAKVDFWTVLCHNLFVSSPSPIVDRDSLTGQLYADETPPATRSDVYQRYTISPVDAVRWVPHLFLQRGDERVANVGCTGGDDIA